MEGEVKIRENADWYYANQDDLVAKYKGKFVAISEINTWRKNWRKG